ncbi:MAG: Gx transporter family protein [Raoultibacter sp.]
MEKSMRVLDNRSATARRKKNARSHTKHLTRCALLIALALIISVIESFIPLPFALPGIKLGLSNIVTVYALFAFGPRDAFTILAIRIFLGAALTGQLAALPFSLAGGAAAFAVAYLFWRFSPYRSVRACSMVSAVAHSIGQIAAATAITATPALAFYLPVLVLASLIVGAITGTFAAELFARLPQTEASPHGKLTR